MLRIYQDVFAQNLRIFMLKRKNVILIKKRVNVQELQTIRTGFLSQFPKCSVLCLSYFCLLLFSSNCLAYKYQKQVMKSRIAIRIERRIKYFEEESRFVFHMQTSDVW